MPSTERRAAPRGKTQLLTAYRCLENGNATSTGFGRALNLSARGALVETPDPFPVGQTLELEFLLDNNKLAIVEGTVTRVAKTNAFYRAAVEFSKPKARARQLIALQAGAKPKPKAKPTAKPKRATRKTHSARRSRKVKSR